MVLLAVAGLAVKACGKSNQATVPSLPEAHGVVQTAARRANDCTLIVLGCAGTTLVRYDGGSMAPRMGSHELR